MKQRSSHRFYVLTLTQKVSAVRRRRFGSGGFQPPYLCNDLSGSVLEKRRLEATTTDLLPAALFASTPVLRTLLFAARIAVSNRAPDAADKSVRRTWLLPASLVLALNLVLAPIASSEDITEGEKLFALKVKPVFVEKCNACHGDDPEKIKGGFDMRNREAILKGGEYFAEEVIMPGKGEDSFLYITTTRKEADYEMPPKEADQLTEEQQWAIRDWINAGAPWPDDERIAMIQEKYAEGVQVATSKALSEEWQNRRYESEKLWAYRPLKQTEVPDGKHPVDWFIDQKIAGAELEPAPTANALSLVRRMSFGLTGLPPSPEDTETFTTNFKADPADAIEKYADQLMQTPHYGEQFAQHWLDVTRYADTAGFANDYALPNAWRYRDYVVRSFNDDKSYQEFVREQIAGDEIDARDPEHLIATGFLRMGPWEHTGMSVFKETRQLWLDDITDSVGQTFLAHALQCAKCHDHKFDPIPTRDYYSMMAIFSTTQFAERNAPFLPSESKANFDLRKDWLNKKVSYFNKQNIEINQKVKRLRKKETGSAKTGANGLDPGDEASQARIRKNINRHNLEKLGMQPQALSVYTGKTNKLSSGKRFTMPEKKWGKGYIEQDAILTGGDVYSPGDSVVPAALSAAESLGEMDRKPFPDKLGKRRLALADWIADPKNPLTARVMVNRVWSWHFGKGIAGNPNNFGGTGILPTHPELLDYLAHWFMDNGWSVKKLNQLLVTSAAYRRSTTHPNPEKLAESDPKGDLYATFLPRRLTAEEFRDAMLATSGELNAAVGGIPVRPDINPEVATQPRQIMGGTASVYEPDITPEQRNRRSLYAEKARGLRDPFFEIFNQPGPDNSCELRETSTVAPQALTLMNSVEIQDRALAFAHRLLKQESASDQAVIEKVFIEALGRRPTSSEMSSCLEHWRGAIESEQALSHETEHYPVKIERTVRAEKTGEYYTFVEHMPAYEDYVPDLQKTKVDARTRGLSHLCVVIFNLNEFAYLD